MLMNNRLKNSVKEAFDNLPSGICYFAESGIPVLCNKQMHRLVFALTGRDLQMLQDLSDALGSLPKNCGIQKDGENYIFPGGSVWSFSRKELQSEGAYIEYLATDVTELYQRRQALEKSAAEHEKVVESLRSISRNVIDITREEEILAMKMELHNELGIALQKLKLYNKSGCPAEEKAGVIEELEKAVRFLAGGIGKSDSPDELGQLIQTAESLGISVELSGELPKPSRAKELFILALRECITNTLRHAAGSVVSAKITRSMEALNDADDLVSTSSRAGAGHSVTLTMRFTNNGRVPEKPITEGGGLGALRRQIERAGGSMTIESAPVFALIIKLSNEIEDEE